MQVSIEKTEGLGRRMTVELPADSIESSLKNKLQSLSRTARVKGFRPGKVPMKVLESKYGEELRYEAFQEAIQSSLYEAFHKENVRPAGQPSVEPQPLEPGKNISYVVTFEVYPEFEPAPLDKLNIERPVVNISDDDVEQVVDNIRRQRSTWQAVEREAKEGDQVMIDFKGIVDGEAFQGGDAADVPLVIGSHTMIAGFEEQLLGARAGDVVIVKVTFPEDYHGKEVAGKDAEFTVTVNTVNESVLPEIDEELIKSFGVEDGNVDTFRKEVRDNMETEKNQAVIRMLKQEVMDKLLEANPIMVPKALVDQEARQLLAQMQANLKSQGMQEHHMAGMKQDMFEKEAEKRVKLGLIVGELVKMSNVKADADVVRQRIEEMASSYENPQQIVDWYYASPDRLNEVEMMVMEEEVVKWVVEQANTTDKSVSFSELMKPASNQN
jgi:trigger factor